MPHTHTVIVIIKQFCAEMYSLGYRHQARELLNFSSYLIKISNLPTDSKLKVLLKNKKNRC